MLCSWLLNVIDPRLRMSIAYFSYLDTTQIMGENIKKLYAMANTPKVHQLKPNIANCKQGDLKVGKLYCKLENLCNELVNFVKV